MIASILHLLGWMLFSLYGFIFTKNWVDIYYVYMNILLALHWSLFKGECILSLIDKWKLDPTYKMGTDTEAYDVINMFGKKHSRYMWAFVKVLSGLKAISLFIVLQRNHYSYSFLISFIYFFYSVVKLNAWSFHFIFFILFIIILFRLKR